MSNSVVFVVLNVLSVTSTSEIFSLALPALQSNRVNQRCFVMFKEKFGEMLNMSDRIYLHAQTTLHTAIPTIDKPIDAPVM